MSLPQMSLLPYIIEELLEERERRYQTLYKPSVVCDSLRYIFDQNFGLGILDTELENHGPILCRPLTEALACGYVRPWRLCPERQSGVCDVSLSKDGFRVSLDVQQFKPEEVSVKIVNDNILVEGKHDEKEDEHGFISRSFTRRYILPENIDPNTIQSTLSSDGVLQLSAEPKAASIGTERTIPVITTAQPCVSSRGDADNKSSPDLIGSI